MKPIKSFNLVRSLRRFISFVAFLLANNHKPVCAVNAVGRDTIKAMATAGPEMEAKLLQSLNLSSVLISDATAPVNLFSTAKGLVARKK